MISDALIPVYKLDIRFAAYTQKGHVSYTTYIPGMFEVRMREVPDLQFAQVPSVRESSWQSLGCARYDLSGRGSRHTISRRVTARGGTVPICSDSQAVIKVTRAYRIVSRLLLECRYELERLCNTRRVNLL